MTRYVLGIFFALQRGDQVFRSTTSMCPIVLGEGENRSVLALPRRASFSA